MRRISITLAFAVMWFGLYAQVTYRTITLPDGSGSGSGSTQVSTEEQISVSEEIPYGGSSGKSNNKNKENIKEKKDFTPLSRTEVFSKLKWTVSPQQVNGYGIAPFTKIVQSGRKSYDDIRKLAEDMPFYDVKMVVNKDTGDTIVSVVDEDGCIKDGLGSVLQIVNVIAMGVTTGENIRTDIKEGAHLKDHWKQFVNTKDVTKSLKMGKQLGTVISELKNNNGVLVKVVDNLLKQEKRIKQYVKASTKVNNLNDPSLRNLPGVELDADDVILKSDQEFTAELEKARQEGELIKGSDDYDKILEELETTNTGLQANSNVQ